MSLREVFVEYGYLWVTSDFDINWLMNQIYKLFNRGNDIKSNIITYRRDEAHLSDSDEEEEEGEGAYFLSKNKNKEVHLVPIDDNEMTLRAKLVEYDYFWLTKEEDLEWLKKEMYRLLSNGWDMKMDVSAYRKCEKKLEELQVEQLQQRDREEQNTSVVVADTEKL